MLCMSGLTESIYSSENLAGGDQKHRVRVTGGMQRERREVPKSLCMDLACEKSRTPKCLEKTMMYTQHPQRALGTCRLGRSGKDELLD